MDGIARAAAAYEAVVRAEWIDNNDHMNLAYYVLVFEAAMAAFGPAVGLQGALSVEQMHTVYEREVSRGDRLDVRTHVIAAGGRRLHLFQEMFHLGEAYRAATLETVVAHAGAVPQAAAARIGALIAPEPPAGAGRRVAMGRLGAGSS